MNFANALGFVCIGFTMWILPTVAPGWFPHTAIDGSSTRALWTQAMGLLQFGLGVAFLAQQLAVPFARWSSALRRGALATADWQTDAVLAPTVGVELTRAAAVPAAPVASGSITLHGEHAVLWRTLHRALGDEQHARHLAAGIRALLRERTRAAHTAHPFAVALFRHHPQSSFVHLVGPHLGAFQAEARPENAQQHVVSLLRQLGEVHHTPAEQRA